MEMMIGEIGIEEKEGTEMTEVKGETEEKEEIENVVAETAVIKIVATEMEGTDLRIEIEILVEAMTETRREIIMVDLTYTCQRIKSIE